MSDLADIKHTRYRVKVISGQRSEEERKKAFSNSAIKYYEAIRRKEQRILKDARNSSENNK